MNKVVTILTLFLLQLSTISFLQAQEKIYTTKSVTGTDTANGGTYTYDATISCQSYSPSPKEILFKLSITNYKITSFTYNGVNAKAIEGANFPISKPNVQVDVTFKLSYKKGYGYYTIKNTRMLGVGQGGGDYAYLSSADIIELTDYFGLKSHVDFSTLALEIKNIKLKKIYFEELANIKNLIKQKTQLNNKPVTTTQNSNTSQTTSSNSTVPATTKSASNAKTYEEIVAESNQEAERLSKSFDKIGNDMSSLFSDGIQGTDFISLSSTLSNEGMTDAAYTSVAVGTALTIGGEIIGAIKQNKIININDNIGWVKSGEEKYQEEYKVFITHLKNNDYKKLIASHKKILNHEHYIIKNLIWLCRKHDSKKYNPIRIAVIKRQNKRIKGILELNTSLLEKAVQTMTEEEIFVRFVSLAKQEVEMHLVAKKANDFNMIIPFQTKYISGLDFLHRVERAKRLIIIENLYHKAKLSTPFFLSLVLLDGFVSKRLPEAFRLQLQQEFKLLNKQQQVTVVKNILSYSYPLVDQNYFLVKKRNGRVLGENYDYSGLEILLDNGNGLNYYYGIKNKKGELIPLHEYISKTIYSKGMLHYLSKEIPKKINDLVKKDEKKTGKKRSELFEEKKDCYNSKCIYDITNIMGNHGAESEFTESKIKTKWNDTIFLNRFAWHIIKEHNKNKTTLNKGLEIIKRAILLKEDYANLDTYAWTLYYLGKHQEALKQIKKAQALAKSKNKAYKTELIELIEKKQK